METSIISKKIKALFIEDVDIEAEETLILEYSLKRDSYLYEFTLIGIFLILVVLFLKLVINKFMDDGLLTWKKAISDAVPICVAFIVYRQWIATRHEISIDKYYDRLDVANKRMEVLYTEDSFKTHMHVYAELDKLEYVILKYKLGYMLPSLALRAVLNFKGHCDAKEWFHKETDVLMEVASYLDETKKIAQKLCDTCKYKQATN